MKSLLSYCLLISIFLFVRLITSAQTNRDNFYSYDKKLKIQLGVSYSPIYTFRKIEKLDGGYHPINFNIPINHTFETNLSLIRKHFIVGAYFNYYKTKLLLSFREDSVQGISTINPAVRDTLKFYQYGIRVGRVGTIKKRLQYEATLGLKYNYLPRVYEPYVKYILFTTSVLIDTINHSIYIHDSERLGLVTNTFVKHFINKIETQLKIKYLLTNSFFLNISLSYNINPFMLFESGSVYSVKYHFYNLTYNNNQILHQIGHGLAKTNFTQLQLGLGISYLF